ncbi:hypothetical protein DFH11DRAFT_1509928, partial [Phellopilus nigrolimitatus]
RQSYLDELVRHDGRGSSLTCQNCEMIAAEYRCTECLGTPTSCKGCLLDTHRHHPLHRIEKWTGLFWEKTSLRSIGLKVRLGHYDEACKVPTREHYLVVYHTNGFHLVDIIYCGCNEQLGGWPKRTQLMRVRWYPATYNNPGTVFTYAMLDQFQELSLQGKISAHDYYQGLAHMSDNTGVKNLPKRYDEFLRTTRCYRHLMLAKRAGRAHDPGGIAQTKQGDLALDCPSCPHPGKNLSDGWEMSDQLFPCRWLYTLVLAIDANFRLKSKDRGVADDPELGPGWAYLVEPVMYSEQLRQQFDKDKSSCDSTFQAIEKATTRTNDGYLVTGVGAVICARSGMVRKNGVGDLQKGERYINMDCIFLSSLLGTLVTLLLVSYDISCQWIKKLPLRVREYPFELQVAFWQVVLRAVVPKFHLKAHGEPCQSPYSLNLLRHSARTDGEGIERGWSHINPIAMATREMGPGFRHDTIDDHWSAYNWRKIIGSGSILLRKLKEALDMAAKQRKNFEELSATFEPGVVATWSAMVEAWQADHNAPDPYAEPDSHVSLADLRCELAKEEEIAVAEGDPVVDDLTTSTFLVKGLELEELRRSFQALVVARKARPHSVQSAVLQERKTTLTSKIGKWRKAQLVFMPCAAIQIAQLRSNSALSSGSERADDRLMFDIPSLCLPSDLTSELRSALSPRLKLIDKEVRLRRAQAEDCLGELRRLLRLKSASLTFKKINNVGQRDNTRARSVIVKFNSKIALTAERYRAARAALQKLDPEESWAEHLRPLAKEDVRGLGNDKDDDNAPKRKGHDIRNQPSEGRRELSWIWSRARSGEGQDAEIDAGIRVEWAKSWARAERWEEEITLVVEEMRRTLVYSDWKAAWWRAQSSCRLDASSDVIDSLRAYAEKQATGWEALATFFAAKWYRTISMGGIAIEWPERYRVAGLQSLATPNATRMRTILAMARLSREDAGDPSVADDLTLQDQPQDNPFMDVMNELYDPVLSVLDGGDTVMLDRGEGLFDDFAADSDVEDEIFE